MRNSGQWAASGVSHAKLWGPAARGCIGWGRKSRMRNSSEWEVIVGRGGRLRRGGWRGDDGRWRRLMLGAVERLESAEDVGLSLGRFRMRNCRSWADREGG